MSEPWTEGGLRIARAALEAIEAHAKEGYAADAEVCGYLVGPAADPLSCDELVRMENLASKLHAVDPETYFRTARTFFAFNSKRFDDAVRRGALAGRPIKVLYHSHLDAGAYFSPTDAAVMSMGEPPREEGGPVTLGEGPAWPLAFLVTSVRASGVDAHGLFVWRGREAGFVEAPFEVA